MISFGMMSLSLKSEQTYFTEIARRANPNIFTCFRFSPAKIHPVTQLVSGERFDHSSNNWVSSEFPLPMIVYDRCFYTDEPAAKQAMAIVKWLKKRADIAFLGNGLPNKWAIYEVLAKSPLSPYIPQTIRAASGKTVVGQLEKMNKAVLKPIFGSGGAGIYKIEKSGRKFEISADHGGRLSTKAFDSASETANWLSSLFGKKEYLMQPYLELSDSQNRPFDIRVLLQKDHQEKWVVRGKGIRRGSKDGILSNLSAGSEILPFEEYANSLNISAKRFILHEMEEILSQLPVILETAFPRLFELGVDIGVSKDNALWVLDTNSKPGRKVITATTPELKEMLYEAPLEYAKVLSGILPEREEQHL